MPNLILVTGATGTVGRTLTKVLHAEGFAVRAATRHIHTIPSSAGVEAVPFDYADTNSFRHALEGVTGVFLVSPPMEPEAQQLLAPFVESAREAGVPHLVFLSALGADEKEGAPLRGVEHAVIDSGIPWTILRPNFFMENFSSGFLAPMIRDHGSIFLAAGDGRTSFVSTQDIAEVATAAFRDGLADGEYALTGYEALDHAEVAQAISMVIGRDIAYHDISEEMMLQGARGQGLSEGAVQYLGELYRGVRAGQWAVVSDDIRRVLNRNPLGFHEFLEANKTAWE